jgi:hypothetical protein
MHRLKYKDLETNSFYANLLKYETIYIVKLIKIMILFKKYISSEKKKDEIISRLFYIRDTMALTKKDDTPISFDVKFNNMYDKKRKCKMSKIFYNTSKKILNARAIENPFEICRIRIKNFIPFFIENDIVKKNELLEYLFNSLCYIFTLDLDNEDTHAKSEYGKDLNINFEQISNITTVSSNEISGFFDVEFKIKCKISVNEFTTSQFFKEIDYPNFKNFKKEIKNAIRISRKIEYAREKEFNYI